MSSGVPGQALLTNSPPSLVQDAVDTQTPLTPPSPVQGPLMRVFAASTAVMANKKEVMSEERMMSCEKDLREKNGMVKE
jgi:hypothetical protein